MPTSPSESGQNVETAVAAEHTERLGPATEHLFGNRVGVVIADESISEDVLRRWLGDALPLRITSWRHHAYQEVIRRLRPRVVVVVATNPELAWDSGNLIACLFARFGPTVVSGAAPLNDRASSRPSETAMPPRLLIHRLGVRAQTELASLADLVLL